MPATINSSLSSFHPLHACLTGDGNVLLVNGIDEGLRWDGVTAATESIGLPQPVAPTADANGSGSITGTYRLYVQFIDDEEIAGDLSPALTKVMASHATFDWTNIEVSSNSRVSHKRLWRTTAGQASVAYLVTTITNATTSYADTVVDGTLDDNESIILANTDGAIPSDAYARAQPPSHISVMVQHQNRIYGGIPVAYDAGCVKVANGSPTVTGVGTRFTSAMVGRLFKVVGDETDYVIDAVSSATSLTLDANYAGTTHNFATYIIQAAASTQLQVNFTYVGADGMEPESWPETYSFQVPSDGGALTAFMNLSSFIYFLKQSKVYRYTVQNDPINDGQVFPVLNTRGCENQRCWCHVDDVAYVLDRKGIYAFTGSQPQPISDQIQDIFRDGGINWQASKWFHAAYDPEREVVKFYVAIGSSYLPRTVLCYAVRLQSWWTEDAPVGIGGTASVTMAARRRLLVGGEHERIYLANEGVTDGILVSAGGTLRGTATSASLMKLTDTTATFPSSLQDVPVAIVDGTGKGQVRRIVSSTSTALTLNQPWTIMPSTDSVYQIGGFAWHWQGGIMRYTQRHQDTTRQFTLAFEPTERQAHLFISQYPNHSRSPETLTIGMRDSRMYTEGPSSVNGQSTDYRHELMRNRNLPVESEGFARQQFDGNTNVNGHADRWISPRIHGHSSLDPIKIYGFEFDGVRN